MTDLTDRYARGVMGEAAAERYLVAEGYACVARRYKAGRGEIDLVCTLGQELLVFVQVKAREHAGTESALAAANGAKQRRMAEAALHFLAVHPEYEGWNIRFDVISVTHEGVCHIPGFFEINA